MEKTLKFWFYPHDLKFRHWPHIFDYHSVDGFIDNWDYIGSFVDTQDYIWDFFDIGDESLQSAPVWSCGCRR